MPDETNLPGPGSNPPPKPPAAPVEAPATGTTGMTGTPEPRATTPTAGTPASPTGDAAPKPPAPPAPEKSPSGSQSLGGDGAPDLLPPPASYELPDEYAETWFASARRWVEEHPALAVAAAAGVGLVIGRIAVSMTPEPEPSLVGKVERRAKAMRKDIRKETKGLLRDARSALKDVSLADSAETMQAKLRQAAAALADATEGVGGRAGAALEDGASHTRDLAESLSEAVRTTVSGVVSKAVDEWAARRK